MTDEARLDRVTEMFVDFMADETWPLGVKGSLWARNHVRKLIRIGEPPTIRLLAYFRAGRESALDAPEVAK